MFILFDQEYNTKLYAREYAKEQKIILAVEMCKKFGLSIKDAIKEIVEKFHMTQEKAARYVNDVWENKLNSEKFPNFEELERDRENLIELKKYLDEYNNEDEIKEVK